MAFGSLKGAFTGNNASIGTSLAISTLASGSGAVNVGDLVYVVVGEQTAPTMTAVNDNLGNTYTALQVATDAGTSTARAFYTRVTIAGTITAITATTNGGTNNGAGAALIIEGPFAPSPLDKNPTNLTNDTTTPYTCPSTTTLAQADEVVIGWVVSTGSAAWTATSPNTKGAEVATAAVLSVRIGYQTVAATTAVSPAWTGTAPTDDVLGTSSFKKDTSVIVQGHYRFRTDAGGVDAAPTWGAAEDTTYLPDVNATFRLRFVLSNTGGNATDADLWQIYASKNGGAYAAVTTSTASVKSADAGSSADNTSLTTQRLTSGSGTFANGQYDESGATSGLVITNGTFTELEFGLDLVASDLTAGDTLDFRVYRNGVAIDTYSVTPRITVADTAAADPDNLTGYLWSATTSDLSASGSANNYSLVGASETDGSWSGQSLGALASAFVAGFTPSGDPGTNGANTQRLIVRLNVTSGNANLRYAARAVRVNSTGVVQAEGFYTESSGGATGSYLLYPTVSGLGTWASGDRLRIDVRIRNTSGSAGQSATIQFGHPNSRTLGPSAVLAPWTNGDCCLSFGEKGHDDLLSDTNRKSQQSRIFGQYNITRSTGVIKPGRYAYWETWFEKVPTGSYDEVQTGIIDHLVKNLGGGDSGAGNDYLGNTEGQSIGISSWSGVNTTSGWYALYNNGYIDPGAGSVATAGSLTAHDGTDRACWAVRRELDGTGKFWVKWGLASDWNGDPTANPATGVGGITISISSSGLWFAAVSTFECASVSDVNPGDETHLLAEYADWLGTAPAGFTQLDGTTVPQPQAPLNQYDWPLPKRLATLPPQWISQSNIALRAVTVAPFSQTIWPLPQVAAFPVTARTWLESYNLNLVGQDELPIRQRDWPLPLRIPLLPLSWVNPRNLALNERPFSQSAWPLPRVPQPLPLGWSFSYNINLIAQDELPFRQSSWPVPQRPVFSPQPWVSQPNIALTTIEARPFSETDWPLPRAPQPLPIGWVWSYNVNLIGADQLPVRQQDWPLPQVARFWTSGRTWTWAYNVNLIAQDEFPIRQADWPLPKRLPFAPQPWVFQPNIAISTIVVFPFNQSNWPLAQIPGIPPGLRTWTRSYNPNLIAQDQLPFRQTSWPTPSAAPFPTSARTWISQTKLLLAEPKPFAQSDWPLPRVAAHPTTARTWISRASLALTAMPFRQSEWPLPQVPRFNTSGRTHIQRQVGMIGRDQFPIRQQSWPLPRVAPVPATAPLRWGTPVPLSPVVVASRARVYGYIFG